MSQQKETALVRWIKRALGFHADESNCCTGVSVELPVEKPDPRGTAKWTAEDVAEDREGGVLHRN